MTLYENIIVFPEGDEQEIERTLSIEEVVDINGHQVRLTNPPQKIIAYRVYKIATTEERGVQKRKHYLELLTMNDLYDLSR